MGEVDLEDKGSSIAHCQSWNKHPIIPVKWVVKPTKERTLRNF
jgi:hypothetical protein